MDLHGAIIVAVIASILGVVGKIVFDWLRNNNTKVVMPVCAEMFAQIQESLDGGDKKFDKIETKIDNYHNDVTKRFAIHGERIRALEVVSEISSRNPR